MSSLAELTPNRRHREQSYLDAHTTGKTSWRQGTDDEADERASYGLYRCLRLAVRFSYLRASRNIPRGQVHTCPSRSGEMVEKLPTSKCSERRMVQNLTECNIDIVIQVTKAPMTLLPRVLSQICPGIRWIGQFADGLQDNSSAIQEAYGYPRGWGPCKRFKAPSFPTWKKLPNLVRSRENWRRNNHIVDVMEDS